MFYTITMKVYRNILGIIIFGLFLGGIAFAQSYSPGQIYYGRNQYIEYHAGDLPLIFSAPHGGKLIPDEIPDRNYGTTVTDSYTKETVLAIRDAIFSFTGHYPHIIIANLKRTKLDPNREIEEGAQGDQFAEQAWNEYHDFIEMAEDSVTVNFGKGFYVDIHGHGHAIHRLELGYLISGSSLFKSDEQLNTSTYINSSSIHALALQTSVDFSQLLRGQKSLGTLFEKKGIPAVPSLSQPNPGNGNPYFSGGYDTKIHGSRDGSMISGVQIEAYKIGLRDTQANRERYAQIITEVFDEFFSEYFGWDGIITSVQKDEPIIPAELSLEQNYPNPFNSLTTITYRIAEKSFVTLIVFNPLGEEIARLVAEEKQPGEHVISFDASNWSNGVYFYRLQNNRRTIIKKLLLLE
ncbi:MAG TPA: T9SS type A sorting domain-containing protein [Bacteroidetes bacterium]|nr:T9SS type A sorting domain-containing protein [Bacteroidota bacterium]